MCVCVYPENTDICTDSLTYAENTSERRRMNLSPISREGEDCRLEVAERLIFL